jgi:signal transduction histidine kinase/ActR/RegA family two-component response regulator
VRDGKGRVVGASKIARDITAQKQAEEENKRLYEALKDSENRYRMLAETLTAADRKKDEFLATLAHELRNPLAPIRNSIQLLQMQAAKGGELDNVHAIIDRQVYQMTRLVDDLMDVSRISQGRIRLRKEKINLEEVVRTAIEMARPVMEEARHELNVELPKLPIMLDGDPIRLAQVVANLLNNAAKYTEDEGMISLTVKRQDSEAVITVIDNGIGIATEHLPLVFEMFSQEAPALQRSQGGLGIGLSLVKGLVELHGGTVSAHSRGTGLGSEFEVRLPIVSRPREISSDLDSGMIDGSDRLCRVLIVDDNRDHAESLGMLLELKGHETKTASDGTEGIDKAKSFKPEVILLDIGMPKLNGYECAQRIRQQPWGQDVVLVALTGWGQEQDKRMAMEAGFDHHLTKPVDSETLERILAAAKTSA